MEVGCSVPRQNNDYAVIVSSYCTEKQRKHEVMRVAKILFNKSAELVIEENTREAGARVILGKLVNGKFYTVRNKTNNTTQDFLVLTV